MNKKARLPRRRRVSAAGAAAATALILAAGCGPSAAAPTVTPSAGEMAPGAVSPSSAATGAATRLRFDDATADSGIAFRHTATYSPAKHIPEIMGGGIVVADFDRNGAPDIVAVNSGAITSTVRQADAANALYLNDGRGHFTDATATWGPISSGYGMGGTAGDFDNDGWTDLVLTGYGDATRLLRNTGRAFEDWTTVSGVPGDDGWTTSAGLFDAEADGDLDLWLTRYVTFDPANAKPCAANDVQVYCTPHLFESLPDQLWINDGAGHFTDGTAAAGIDDARGKGISVSIVDLEGDGDMDVYVANDITANQMWINDGAGHFTDEAPRSGTALSRDGRAEAGMGSDVSDVNGDGRLDIAVSNFLGESSAIYQQGDDLLFEEVADRNGVGQPSRQRLKWGTAFFDADNDGDEELMVASGHIYDNAPEVDRQWTFAEPNLLFEHLGDGSFREVSASAGPALADSQVSRGLAMADFDSDGGVEFVVGNNGGTLQLGRNATPDRGNWVGLWLEGSRANRSAIGARLTAKAGPLTLTRQVKGADSMGSLSDRRLVLGLGDAAALEALTIEWPGGEAQQVGPLAAGAWYRLVQGGQPVAFIPGREVIAP